MRIIKFCLSLISICLVAGTLLIMDKCLLFFQHDVVWPIGFRNYSIAHTPLPAPAMPDIKPVPDLSGYTMENLTAKIPLLQTGKVGVVPMKDSPGLTKFLEKSGNAKFKDMQDRTTPAAFQISSGVYDLDTLSEAMEKEGAMEVDDGAYILKMPLYVASGATLIIRGKPENRLVFKMLANSGAFLASSGTLFIVDADVSAWDSETDTYAEMKDKYEFRPFITVWTESKTYMGRSSFRSLGYSASKSYGISFSTVKAHMKSGQHDAQPPTGWLIDSRFEDLYYGFYSFEAEDVAILRNVYANNIIYGIDPHDRSKRLIIAFNEAYGTHKKHGIIVSREVNDSWIVNNVSHHNNRSGFMLDRTSVRNLVADNVSYENGADGMTLFESEDNVVRNNHIYKNRKNGLRVRNSWNIVAHDNVITQNDGVGVQLYAFDISDSESDRDFILDPFTQKASMTLTSSVVALNKSGAFKIADVEYFALSKIEFLWDAKKLFRGNLNELSDEIALGLRRSPRSIEIVHVASKGDEEEDEEEKSKDDDDE